MTIASFLLQYSYKKLGNQSDINFHSKIIVTGPALNYI